jgi:hypothetical protein
MGGLNEYNGTITAWADIVLKEWIAIMKVMDIGRTGNLQDSLDYFVNQNAGGDLTKVSFFFEYYGLFVDMGVGNGVAFDEHYDTNRVPKRWVDEVYKRNVRRLEYIMVEKYAKKIITSSIALIKDSKMVTRATD